MTSKRTRGDDFRNLTQEESESIGMAVPEEPAPASINMQARLLHEQVLGSLDEDEVTGVLSGEVTPETRAQVEDLYADLQEEVADRQVD
jgi:hypothetical protein